MTDAAPTMPKETGMKLAMLRARTTGLRPTGTEGMRPEPRLTVVGEGSPMLAWPTNRGGAVAADDRDAEGRPPAGVTVTAELRTRRFADGAVQEERYTATATALDRSPGALLAALAEGLRALEDGDGAFGSGERMIVEVRVVA